MLPIGRTAHIRDVGAHAEMTTSFDISIHNSPRTFKEKLNDLLETSLGLGLLKLLVFIILLIPLILLAIGESIFNWLTGKRNKTPIADLTQLKLETKDMKVKPFDIYERDDYYNYLKTTYNYTDDDLRDLDEFCFIETTPAFQTLDKRVFTYHMTAFCSGVVIQEVVFNKTPWGSRLLFLDSKSGKTETIRELDYIYRLSFDKPADNELICELRLPGDKQILTIKTKRTMRQHGL
tara:strand:- start:40 stop:744 length:705 start_codon:yes stop_codon:yes gene_type:complete